MRRKILIAIAAVALITIFTNLAVSNAEKKKQDDLYRQVELFSDTLAIIQSEYVDETKPKDVIYGALKGMLSSLDPHSQFMDPETYNELKIETEGKFGGLGIEITIKDGLLTVVTPIDDTPAWKAGIKAGDRIVKIDDQLTRDMELSDAVKKMRGKPGDPVTLTILRESEKKLLDIKIVRDMIKIRDIKEARILEDGVGYIRLVEFRENSQQEFQNALDRLYKEGMNSLILDLRNNPGGLLDVAVKVAEKFVDKGKLIVSTKGRKPNQNFEFNSHNSKPVLTMPVVVLINEGSASGSEIVAGCLQDYKRALIIGTKSFGKGSVQTVIPLSDGSALRLTTSKYFTPSGKVIHGKGVDPDIVVESVAPASKEEDEKQVKVDQVFDQLEKNEKQNKDKQEFNWKSDNQLVRAVDILKAAKFYKSTEAQ